MQFPVHRAAASLTEMKVQSAPAATGAGIGPAGASRGYARPGIIGAHTEHRSRTSLALQAMAGDYKIRLARKRSLQFAAGTACNSDGHAGIPLAPLRACSIGSVPFQVPWVSSARNRVNDVRSAVCSLL